MPSASRLSDIDLARFLAGTTPGADAPASEALCAQLAASGARACSMAFGASTEERVEGKRLWQAARSAALEALSERALGLCADSKEVVSGVQEISEGESGAERAHERAVEHVFELLEVSAAGLRLAAAGAGQVPASCATDLGLGVLTLGASLRACLPLLEARVQGLESSARAEVRVAAARAVVAEGAQLERELCGLLAIPPASEGLEAGGGHPEETA